MKIFPSHLCASLFVPLVDCLSKLKLFLQKQFLVEKVPVYRFLICKPNTEIKVLLRIAEMVKPFERRALVRLLATFHLGWVGLFGQVTEMLFIHDIGKGVLELIFDL